MPSFSEENQMKGTVNFFLRGRPQKKLVVLTILSSAEAAGGFLSGLLYADTKSIYNAIAKKSDTESSCSPAAPQK